MTVRVRIAPSPTGDPHVGTAYIALFNLIFARHYQGKFILRIEDTDQSRSRPEYEKSILEALKWCQIDWDEGPDIGGAFGPYRQSERTTLYQKYAEELLEKGFAYKCFADEKELQEMREKAALEGKKSGYDRRYRNLSKEEVKQKEDAGLPFVVRLKVPLEGKCEYEDAVKGKISVPWADIDDQILLKSDGYPTYHLANVVDDHLMEITHVIRGDEWLSSTPKHILLYQGFGWKAPIFYHMPLLLGQDGKKLSKRRNPTSIFYFRDVGYLSESLVNFLTLMGYSMPNDLELYSLAEIIEAFDPKRIGTSGAFFDMQKLSWLNQKKMIETMDSHKLWGHISNWALNPTFIEKLMPLIHKRIKTFGDFFQIADFFFINDLKLSVETICPKNLKAEEAAILLQVMIWELEESSDWSKEGFESASRLVSEKFDVHYKKVVMHILFASIMGKLEGPSLFQSAELLGKDRTRARLMDAITLLGGISNKKLDRLSKAWKRDECKTLFSDS